jgi:hypothetical protein
MSGFVTKADGSRQLFDREKVIKTCLRMGASRKIAEMIANEVEQTLFDGISTEIIFQKTLRLLRKHEPIIQHLLDLRKGLSLMNSRPEFELFIQILLRENGYVVTPNQIIRGKCGEHEVDAIAKKNNFTFIVEAKHHIKYHTPTGLDESRIARAILEDVTEGFEYGQNTLKIDRAMILTNTKFSAHARQYGECRKILQIGWNSPRKKSLQDMIEENKLHPVTCLRNINTQIKRKLSSRGIILMKQLIEEEPAKLARRISVSTTEVENLIEKAKTCFYTLHHP